MQLSKPGRPDTSTSPIRLSFCERKHRPLDRGKCALSLWVRSHLRRRYGGLAWRPRRTGLPCAHPRSLPRALARGLQPGFRVTPCTVRRCGPRICCVASACCAAVSRTVSARSKRSSNRRRLPLPHRPNQPWCVMRAVRWWWLRCTWADGSRCPQTKKRRNGGKNRCGRGHVGTVHCSNCYRLAPKVSKARSARVCPTIAGAGRMRGVADKGMCAGQGRVPVHGSQHDRERRPA